MYFEDKKNELKKVDIDDYDYVVVFNSLFCFTCIDKELSNARILFLNREDTNSKMYRISISNKILRMFVNSDVFFFKKENTFTKENILFAKDEFMKIYSSKSEENKK
ncbi:MAG: hypothetical protein U0L67_06005 [Paludibacteraceae bacterium]|nr:hypothetical protein [Bacteroidales bacterium]MEE0911987.1 hypothetical protein [Paludibacteraceae bacterium]MEE0927398.1 hypothetical protein [Bacteroidales bacterium]MEE0937393.1 hypothetical protein [Bacteroidales bacterium]MEE0948475.1 hypothetical protein [Bacteroidales bacterium]